jgi:nucleotide-binding universal stress UspA family protein
MRSILVAVDGSESALRALDFAARQARLAPVAELHVLTIKQPANAYTAWEIYVTAERIQQVANERARAILDAAAQRLQSAGCRFELEVLEGEPAETIARRAAELGSEAIVMGTHGLGQLGVLIMGSVAQRVLHHTSLPVTLVK